MSKHLKKIKGFGTVPLLHLLASFGDAISTSSDLYVEIITASSELPKRMRIICQHSQIDKGMG